SRPRHPIGWIILLIAVSGGTGAFLPELGRLARDTGHPSAEVIGWFSAWVWWPMFGSLPLLGLLFPDGRLPSRRWRPVFAVFVGLLVVPVVVLIVVTTGDPTLALIDPVDLPDTVIMKVNEPAFIALTVAIPVALLAVAVRWRRATALERRQLVWLAWALAVWAVWGPLSSWLIPEPVGPEMMPIGELSHLLADALIPAAIAVAVLRYRLYAIDVIIEKSLIWALLTAVVIATYISIVTLLGATLIRGEDSRLSSLVAAAVIAVGFAPLQRQLRVVVDRAIYGRRGDPAAVLADLTTGVQQARDPGEVLPTLVRGLAKALKLPYVAVEPKRGPRVAYGEPRGHTLRLSLTHFGAPVGALVVSKRGPSDPLSPADRRVLDHVRPIASTAVYATDLSAELRRSREGVVRAREEERRRLRRDLHDGMKPALAGLALSLEATARSATRDTTALPRRMRELRDIAQTVAFDVGRIVEDLRPATLDEAGLADSLREKAEWLSQQDGTRITVETPEIMPPLPAAVEVAAYRIAVEAMTNVVRHARATSCTVSLEIADTLDLRIVDNGIGLSDRAKPGIGFESMQERADELGGQLSIDTLTTSGVRVSACLPLRVG
ncbi:MAG: sensor histidine kinase, partial [Gemmatimonadota bacterium]|nr:sensor histidine kinase [Gemmatimonadota bacterium]